MIEKIHDNGIGVLGSFIYGTDFDTKESLDRLLDFIAQSNIDTTYVKLLTPFPGTEIYQELKDERRLFNERYWTESPYPVFTFKPSKISGEDLIKASLDFVNLYTFSKSTLRLGKSLLATKNFFGSMMSFLSNYGDYCDYKNYYKENKTKLEGIFKE